MIPYTIRLATQAQGPNDLASPIAGASVTVIKSNGSLETLTDANGGTLPQPVFTNALGMAQINVPNPGDVYTMQYRYGGKLQRVDQVIIGLAGLITQTIVQYLETLPDVANGDTQPTNGPYRSAGVVIAP